MEQFLRWGSAPNPAQVPRVMVLVVGLGFWLVLVIGLVWLVLMVGFGLVGSGWLVLVGSSFLGNQFYWLNLGWPEF